MPFYKIEDETLITATHIEGLNFSLSETGKGEYTYPVNGWHWYATEEAARLGLEFPEETT